MQRAEGSDLMRFCEALSGMRWRELSRETLLSFHHSQA